MRLDDRYFERIAARVYSQLARNPARALRLAEDGLRVARRNAPGHSLARMTLCRAHALRECGRHREALRDYDRAARIFRSQGKTVESWRTAIGKIDALNLSGDYGRALACARAASLFFRRAGLPLWEGKIYANTGNIYQHLDRYDLASRYYRLAHQMLAAEIPLDGHIALFNQANIYLNTGKPAEALESLRACKDFFESQKLTHFLARTHYNLGYAHYLLGKYQDALQEVSAARSMFRSLRDRSFLASCGLDQAELLLRLNRTEDALRSARRARRSFEALKMPYEAAEADALIGALLLKGDRIAVALKHLRSARRFFESRRNSLKSAELATHIAVALSKSSNPSAARLHLKKAYGVYSRQRIYPRMLSCVTQVGALMAGRGDFASAEAALRKARPWLGRVRLPWVLLPYFQVLGNVQAERGQQAASRSLARAIRLIEEMRSEIPAEDLRISFFEDKLQPYNRLISLALRRGGESAARRAFDYSERARSRVLLDLLEGSLSFRSERPGTRPLPAGGAGWRTSGVSDGRAAPALERRREREILRAFRNSQRALPRAAEEPASVEAIQKNLLPGQAIISYYCTGRDLHAFVLDDSGLTAFRDIAPVDEIRNAWHLLRFQIERARFDNSAPVSDCMEHLQRLGFRLIEPLSGRIERSRLWTIFPHDWLHGLPFHCLADRHGLLADRHIFSYAPSAAVYLHARKRKATEEGVLLFGVPDENAPAVDMEIREISELVKRAEIYSGGQATALQLKTRAHDARILHVAGHAVFKKDQPLFSGLMLADGWLTVPGIYGLPLRADLVTLSGCETGSHEVSAGDELLGLTRGFLYAGARSLLVSLWRVSDVSTAFLMKRFYSALLQGVPKAEACNRAMLETRSQWPHPYYWAPFHLIGSPD